MADTLAYTVRVKSDTGLAVLVLIPALGIVTWLPRSQVTMPETIHFGDTLEVEIPRWLIRNEREWLG
ncbi:MAG: hypothetical protein KUA35_10360 [Pseudodesulfovibrio sp.]|uniref:Uncharacterized protein n=1 Tax=Pseudodesulfovibrio aespoeensis (strain ATCC 700646 / DSM 10631 / Aspo-2) TaxID=643562 RepID=E6VUC7_PSEA9|nr:MULTISPECIES: hypothetical protein [Pseudodesulfovibrio]MBU4243481.1 hypothetical protein [Pseudomonadota bacterium]ADU63434.1 hypothetical protein Daes_2429 [Pseudodesulfovibrio aespoeensis Aspo-2]MBU4380252.1 hypothetical protein [Pseudomonadota bacterium]MBU4473815.1 hypothetical protein [Pseudomonadota bacterium]MBU4517291.1 hypothetical protein [Pseudomonadota bacterium]